MKLAHDAGWIDQVPSFLYETAWLIALTTVILFLYLYRWGKPSLFVQLYLLSMAVKLIAYFGYNMVMVIDDRPGAAGNVLYFLVVYVLYTTLEIAFLYRRVSRRTDA